MIDSLVQKWRNSIANALELRFSWAYPSIWHYIKCKSMDHHKVVISPIDTSFPQGDLSWYHARCSDGKVGMIPSNHVKVEHLLPPLCALLEGEHTEEEVSVPQGPLNTLKSKQNVQATFSNAFSLMKAYKFRLRFHWSLFPRIQLTIFHRWFR